MIQSDLFNLASGAASFVTPAISIGDLTTYAVFVLFPGGGTLEGDLTLEASPDTDDANFVTLAGSQQTVNASTQHTWSAIGQGYRYVRVRWVYSAGAGNMQILIQIKEIAVRQGA